MCQILTGVHRGDIVSSIYTNKETVPCVILLDSVFGHSQLYVAFSRAICGISSQKDFNQKRGVQRGVDNDGNGE